MTGESVSVQSDETITVYADGVRVVDGDNTKKIIPRATRVLAIRGLNSVKTGAYIAASFSTGFKTAIDRWKCTNQEYPGWRNVDYDDTDWSPAVEYGPARNVDAQKIWTADTVTGQYVYCRGYFGKMIRCNHGNCL